MRAIEDSQEAVAQERHARVAEVHEVREHTDAGLAAAALLTAERFASSSARVDATEARLDETADELRRVDAAIQEAATRSTEELHERLDEHSEQLQVLGTQVEAQADALATERASRTDAVRGCAADAAAGLAAATVEVEAVRAEVARVDEGQASKLNELRYKIQNNLSELEQGLLRSPPPPPPTRSAPL